MTADDQLYGKIVSVWVKSAAQGCWLQDVEVCSLGGRDFIVGRLPDPGPRAGERSPLVGKVYWFPLDDVIQLIEFDDLESAWAVYARYGSGAGKPTPGPPG